MYTIGCEVEFEYVSKGRVIHYASNVTNVGNTSSKFGTDGCSAIAEFRSAPVKIIEFEKIFNEMVLERTKREIAINVNRRNFNFNLRGWSYPTGMHLHFGCSEYPHILRNRSIENTKLLIKLRKALNRYLGLVCYNGNSVARMHGYGSLNGEVIRQQTHGIEYRALPAWVAQDKYAFNGALYIFIQICLSVLSGKIGRVDESKPAYPHEYKKLGIDYNIVKYLRKHCNKNNKGRAITDARCWIDNSCH